MPDFWRHSGFHLTRRDASGCCVPSDDLLRAYLARPEIAPIESSCSAERALFAALQEEPRRPVGAAELAALLDPEARANYVVVLAFRERLLAAGTLECAYRNLFVDAAGKPADFAASGTPPLFADQLVQMIVRNLLDDCDDGLAARAAEIMFREQIAHLDAGRVLLADSETITLRQQEGGEGGGVGNLGRLIEQAQTSLKPVELDVLDAGNASSYWSRDERHDTVIQINHGSPGLDALCRVIERWLRHFYAVDLPVRPVRSIDSARLHWYVGLDATATGLMNDLYNARSPNERAQRQLLCLMELQLPDAFPVVEGARGRPCYLALAMDENDQVRMKPQNLLVNLPLVHPA